MEAVAASRLTLTQSHRRRPQMRAMAIEVMVTVVEPAETRVVGRVRAQEALESEMASGAVEAGAMGMAAWEAAATVGEVMEAAATAVGKREAVATAGGVMEVVVRALELMEVVVRAAVRAVVRAVAVMVQVRRALGPSHGAKRTSGGA